MKRFAKLYATLDETTKTNEKVAALADYFASAPAADAAWAVYFLSGRRPRMAVNSRKLATWAAEEAEVPMWLFEESYGAVGDLAETIALLLPPPAEPGTLSRSDGPDTTTTPIARGLDWWVEGRLLPLRSLPEDAQRASLLVTWRGMSTEERFVWNKLITGAWRVGVSQRLVTRALAETSGVDPAVIAHRLMGAWEPSPEFFKQLVSQDTTDSDISRPYPFFLAHPLSDRSPSEGGATIEDLSAWQVEWKWDGIRAQLVRRGGRVFVWSRGEELVTDRFPEISEAAQISLPDGIVLDGEILPWRDGVRPFAQLQRRIGRKSLSRRILEDVPVVFLAYDLMELKGTDVRERALEWRRQRLEELMEGTPEPLKVSPTVIAADWDSLVALRESSRDRNVEGFMLKRLSSPYRVGRVRGDWWKWKVDPFTVDAVLIYAQRGSGRRASLYTDYTFGVWDEDSLVPIAKAYSGLTDDEIRLVDAFVRRNTIERFGPVRSVKPELVFEIAFEGIRRSTRHKSGVALRFPRMSRWRQDKPAAEADTLETVKALLSPPPA